MKKKLCLLVLILSMSLYGCNDNEDNEEIITYETSNINMIDRGKITAKFDFRIEQNESRIYNCYIRVNNIKTGDHIDNIMVAQIGTVLKISIVTSPNSFECNDLSCFSIHDIKFDIIDLKKGTYSIDMGINNVYNKPFNYTVK